MTISPPATDRAGGLGRLVAGRLTRALMGENDSPCGVETNYKERELIICCTHAQGLSCQAVLGQSFDVSYVRLPAE